MFSFFGKKKSGFGGLGFTADCHCHLLPGVDDGVQELAESLSILRKMSAAGIRKVVLTPHMNPDAFPGNSEQFLKRRYDEFIKALPADIKENVGLRLGAEYMVTEGFEKRAPEELLQFKDGKVLVEMSYLFESRNMEESIFNITMAGLTPVIAHPERYLYLASDLKRFNRYHDMGAEFQMNLLSLSGAYGPGSLKILDYLLSGGLYSHWGTDTHSLHHIDNIVGMTFDSKRLPNISNL